MLPASLNRDLVLGCILLVVTLAAYRPAWNGKPIWDDNAHITKPELRSAPGLARIWTQLGATKQYYPLVHSVFWLEYRLWGDAPLGYHLLNILLHVLSALILVRILRYLKISGKAAWLAGAIFALHPVQVESVAWITELKNTLSGVFFLATALAYLKFDCERKRKYYVLAFTLFVLGLLSKSVIATLPVSLLVVFWWKQGRIRWKHDAVPLLPFFITGIASGLFTAWVERTFIGAEGSDFTFTIIERCLIAGRAAGFYLGKLFWPANLIFIYPRWNINPALWWQYLFPAAVLLLAGALWALRNIHRAPLAVFLYFTVTLFPALGFLNVYSFRYSFAADHFQYLACIGPLALSAAGMESVFGFLDKNLQVFFRPAFYGILLLTLGVLSWKQSGMYRDAETLYRTIIQKNPDCWMAHNNLGLLLANTGRTDEALAHYRGALEINPNDAKAHNNLGLLLAKMGRTGEAVAQYRRALEIYPNSAEVHNNLGLLLANTGRTDEAVAQYRKALEINPNYANAHNNLGLLLANTGRTDEAMTHFQMALEINPNDAKAHNNLGLLLANTGRTDEAVAQYRKALEINPNSAEVHNNLGLLLANTGRTDEAITHYRKALEINPNYAKAHNNLGLLLAKMGQTDEAVAQYRRALEIYPDDINVLSNLAGAFVQKGQPADAIQVLERALDAATSAGQEQTAAAIAAAIENLSGKAGAQRPPAK
ncbi:MAG: tetratricopeptide repeat protein [Chitinispirillaceae bacterium]|jgi:Flp pilus assembly protein TadD